MFFKDRLPVIILIVFVLLAVKGCESLGFINWGGGGGGNYDDCIVGRSSTC